MSKCLEEKKNIIYKEIQNKFGNNADKVSDNVYYFNYDDDNGFKKAVEFRKNVMNFLKNHKDYGETMSIDWTSSPYLSGNYLQVKVEMPVYVVNTIEKGLQKKENIEKGVEDFIEELEENKSTLQFGDTEISIEEVFENLFGKTERESSDALFDEIGKEELFLESEIPQEEPDNYQEYYDVKMRLLEKMKDKFERFKKSTSYHSPNYKSQSKIFRETIAKLEEDLKILRVSTNKNTVYDDVMNEINYLNNLLETVRLDNLDTTDFVNRLNMLSRFFLNHDIEGVVFKDENRIIYNLAGKYPETFAIVTDKVQRLVNSYKQKLSEFVSNLALSNPLLVEHLANEKFDVEEIEEIINTEIENLEDVNKFRSLFLGSGTGGGLLGQLIRIHFESKLREEQGSTLQMTDRLQTLWSLTKLKNNNLTDLFVQHRSFKDEKGNIKKMRTDKLINRYNYNYFELLSSINQKKKQFYLSNSPSIYRLMMNQMKENQEIIDITKLKVFQDIYGSIYSEYFTSSDAEMQNYETDLRQRLGESYYNQIIKEQKRLLQEYTDYLIENSKDNSTQNPFVFIKHFNSENYNQPLMEQNVSFPLSSYVYFIPKTDVKDAFGNSIEYYNPDFKVINDDPKYSEIWEILHTLLTDFINPTLRATGMDVNTFDLPLIEKFLSEEMLKTKNLVGKTGEGIKYLFDLWKKSFADSRFNRDENYNKNRNVRVEYYNTVKGKVETRTNWYKNKSYQELKQIAVENKIPFPDITEDLNSVSVRYEKEKIMTIAKNKLAKIIAEHEVYQRVDNDLIGNIIALTHITNNARARMNTVSLADAIKFHIGHKLETVGKTDAIVKNEKYKNLTNFLNGYINRNILGDTLSEADKKKSEKVFFNKFFNAKYKDVFDKQLAKQIKEEQKNLTNKNTFDFVFEGRKYFSKEEEFEGKKVWRYYSQIISNEKKPVLAIDRNTIESVYSRYLTNMLDDLGIGVTVGSVAMGFQHILVLKALGLNPESGLRNRLEGMLKNYRFAASERFGFSEDDLYNAKKFLSWYNLRRYSKSLKISPEMSHRSQQLETFQKLISQFGLLQDKKNEMSKVSEYSKKKKNPSFLMDFAINNPENHNQGEIIAAIMMRNDLKITDVDGNTVPFFDVVNMEFVAYKPGTLELKDQYRTAFNERVWERFEETSIESFKKIVEEKNLNGKILSRNPHIALLSLIESSIERSQGNYNDKDVARIQSKVSGRILMLFKRYLPEHLFQQYGKMNIDLITGTKDYKGAKTVLLEHFPAASVYLMSLLGTSYGSFGLFSGLASNVAFTIGMSGIVPALIFITSAIALRNKTGKVIKNYKDELKLSIDFFQEILLRSLDMPLILLTGGKFKKISPFIKASKAISKSMRKNASENYISEQDRKIMSENAVEIASKVALITASTLLKTILTAIIEALFGDDDDEIKKKKLKKLNGYFNFISNTANTIIKDIDKHSNPTMFIQDVTRIQLMQYFENTKDYLDDVEDYNRKLTPFDVVPDLTTLIPIPVPRQLVDLTTQALEGELPSYFKDKRQYQVNWWDYVSPHNEKIANAKNKNYRIMLKKQLTKEFIAQMSVQNDYLPKEEIKQLSEKYAENLLKSNFKKNYYIDELGNYKKETSIELIQRLNYHQLIQDSKERENYWKSSETD
jgi:hypothetical protein